METPAIDALTAKLGVGPEPTNEETAAAIVEGFGLLKNFFVAVDQIALSLAVLSNRTN